jgi:hypothetical protein
VTRKLDACERLLRADDESPLTREAARRELQGALAAHAGGWQPCNEPHCAAAAADGALDTATASPLTRADPPSRRADPPAERAEPAEPHGARAGKRARGPASAGSNGADTPQLRAVPPPPPAERGAVVLLATGLSERSAAQVKLASRTLAQTSVVKAWSSAVTHIITEPIDFAGKRLASRTFKHLCGILSGQWIVSSEWLRASLDRSEYVPEAAYELQGDMSTGGQGGPSKGRAAHAAGRSAIFAGCAVYLHGKFSHPSPSRQQLLEVLALGGGAAASAPPTEPARARESTRALVLCDAEEATPELLARCAQLRVPVLSPKWLMDCISHVRCLGAHDVGECAEYRLDAALVRDRAAG